MFGLSSPAIARASRSKRAGSACGLSSLIATRRSSSRSCAAQTSAIPPTPIRSSRRYPPPLTFPATGGADTVIPLEEVVEHDNRLVVSGSVPEGANIRLRGGDVAAGDAVLATGTRLGAAQVGALAAAGIASVACARRPRAAVLATGTEL